jgi:lipoprotein-anchoring transpeptidase ErfK/SrfK
MRRSSNPFAACAVAATVLAACTAGFPSTARADSALQLYANGSDVAIPKRGVVLVHAAPGSTRILTRVGARTAFGSPARMAVLGGAGEWLVVISAALGNRVRGFVHRTKVRLVHVPFSLEVDRSARMLTVWRMGVALQRFPVGVGRAISPTPLGRFSITDKLENFMTSVYGCCIVVLSGRQTQMPPGWYGGDRLAIHVGAGAGEAVSAGCLRADERDVRYLLATIPLGTQVVIHQ